VTDAVLRRVARLLRRAQADRHVVFFAIGFETTVVDLMV
jgi:hydrogenase maturation factor